MIPRLPPPILSDVLNGTRFPHDASQKMAKGRLFCDVVTIKGTFALGRGELALADEQIPPSFADTYHDRTDASRSSVERPGDVHLAKPGTDVIVTGTAHAPGGRPTFRWACEVVVADGARPLLDHRLVASGPRRWERRAVRGWTISDPEPATSAPIRYELAYGGHVTRPDPRTGAAVTTVHRENPSGTGVFDEEALEPSSTPPAPRWELAGHPVVAMNRDSPLAGLGPVARMWAARLRYAGTYDDAWRRRVRDDAARGVVPDYAEDFDPRFFHCAHPALITPAPLRGDEAFVLRGLCEASAELSFRLPAVRPRAEVLGRSGGWREVAPPPLETVHVDLDAGRVHAVWRMVLDPREGIECVMLSADGKGGADAQAHG